MDFIFLDSRFRGNDTAQAASLRSQRAFPTRGEARCFVRVKCYESL